MKSELFANPSCLSTWAPARTGSGKSRHDYDSKDHVLSEMMNETYWSTLIGDIVPGDLIWITDAESAMAIIRIDWIDTKARTVGISLQERLTERAVVAGDGMAVKYRGPRGGLWCVLDDAGEIISRDNRTRDEAERQRDLMRSTAPKAA